MQMKNKGFLILQIQTSIAIVMMIYLITYEAQHKYSFVNLVFGILAILLITIMLIKQSYDMFCFKKDNYTIISMPSMKIANGILALVNVFLVFSIIVQLISFSISSLTLLYICLAYMQTNHPMIAVSDDTLYFVSRRIRLESIRKMDTSKIKDKYTTVYVFTNKQYANSIPDDICDKMRTRLYQFKF